MSVLLDMYKALDYRDFEVLGEDGDEYIIMAPGEDEAWEEATERGLRPAHITELEPAA